MKPSGYSRKRRFLAAAGAFLSIGLFVAACDSDAADQAVKGNEALQSQVYGQKNNIEFDNYNRRQQVADDPSTILWCTMYPSNPNARPVTWPIKGKLTSSSKRPYSTTSKENGYELPGPDKMYGGSEEYRYGFTPGGVYVDFTRFETNCTTQPTVYQKNSTDIVLKQDTGLTNASAEAKKALEAGDADRATRILEDAIGAK